jgi:uncharacterized protein YlxW (UPF0749 family)
MHRLRSQVSITLVAFLLGLLVVAQLRSQQAQPALAGVSSQDLTVLVANLNSHNDQLRTEIATLERELADLRGAQSRGETSVDQLRTDVARLRAFAGLEPVAGPGVVISVNGRITSQAVDELVNELWSAGAEAVAIDEVRVVAGSVVAGPPGALTVDGDVLKDPFEVSAIGARQTLTGSLTRIGGIVAQLAATEELATLTVTPVDRVVIKATYRSLVPRNGTPRL